MAGEYQPSLLSRIALGFLHWIHFLLQVLKCCIPRPQPRPLDAPRKQTPKHVALLLQLPEGISKGQETERVTDDMAECIQKVSEWCLDANIETLSVYDKRGILKQHHDKISTALSSSIPSLSQSPLSTSSAPPTSNPHLYALHPSATFPMTPPPSDGESSSDSSAVSVSPVLSYTIPRMLRPEQTSTLRRRTTSATSSSPNPTLRVNLICREQGKPALARAAQYLSLRATMAARQDSSQSSPSSPFGISLSKTPGPGAPLGLNIHELNTILEPEFSAPDLLVVHPLYYPPGTIGSKTSWSYIPIPPPLELSAFPPWQIRLSEIYYDPLPPSRFFSLLIASLPFGMRFRRPAASHVVITETEFRRALDEFGKAEMKVGK